MSLNKVVESYKIIGMICVVCVKVVERVIKKMDGVYD